MTYERVVSILELLQQRRYRKFNRSTIPSAYVWADDASFAVTTREQRRVHLSADKDNERVTLCEEQSCPIKRMGDRCIRWFDSSIDVLANGYNLDGRRPISGFCPHLKHLHPLGLFRRAKQR